jgi:hypothetical protein
MKPDDHPEAAFSLGDGDRFRCIVVSDGIRYDKEPDAETVITFFVIRRSTGLHDIFHVTKTFKGKECVSRRVQSKTGITAARIDKEIADIREVFARGIQDATGYVLTWNTLNLSEVRSRQAQIRRINAWGRVGVRVAAEIPPIGLN